MAKSILTAERLREVLTYYPETGEFFWRLKTGRGVVIGRLAGSSHSGGYRQIGIDGKRYLSQRLAWLYVHGEWPEHQIDHKNRTRVDNRETNLRDIGQSGNLQNQAHPRSNNTSGFLGVSWCRRARKWRACITVDDKQHHLGFHPTPELAHAAYLSAKARLHPFSTITNVRA